MDISSVIEPTTGKQDVEAATAAAVESADERLFKAQFHAQQHHWHWNEFDKADKCCVSKDKREALFHPEMSESVAAVRGSQPLKRDGSVYFWKMKVARIIGTSTMFGVATRSQQLAMPSYCNLIGLDGDGWSMSHKGLVWHNGLRRSYAQPFPNPAIDFTVGCLLATSRGELSFSVNGQSLGVAFNNLNDTSADLYPIIGSTALMTRVKLMCAYRSCFSLREFAKFSLVNQVAHNRVKLLQYKNIDWLPNDLLISLVKMCNKAIDEFDELDEFDRNKRRVCFRTSRGKQTLDCNNNTLLAALPHLRRNKPTMQQQQQHQHKKQLRFRQ